MSDPLPFAVSCFVPTLTYKSSQYPTLLRNIETHLLMTYQEYEKTVYDWLLNRQKKRPDFYFSTRQKGSKGAETDIFIGTENSKYFGTTFWTIPIAYPGASSDFTNVIFRIKGNSFRYELSIRTRPPAEDRQNGYVIELARNLQTVASPLWKRATISSAERNMIVTKISAPKKDYRDLDKMLVDLDKDLKGVY